jgi:hypothetical protein
VRGESGLITIKANLAYVAYDEPLFFGNCYSGMLACHYPIETVASNCASSSRIFKSYFPNVQIGGIFFLFQV